MSFFGSIASIEVPEPHSDGNPDTLRGFTASWTAYAAATAALLLIAGVFAARRKRQRNDRRQA